MGNIDAGANPDELDRLASLFGGSADRIRSIQRSLNPQINGSPWHGRNAERFRQQWSAPHRRAIEDAIRFLDDGCSELRRHADEQRRVSGSGTAGSGPSGPRASGVDLEAGTIVNTFFDLVDIATGAQPSPLGFGISIGLGAFDLFFDRDGYDGDYTIFESVMDGLGIAAAGVGLAGLVALAAGGAAVSAPVAVAVVGVAAISGALIKGADLFFGTEVGHQVLDAGADMLDDAWRWQAELLEAEWGSVVP